MPHPLFAADDPHLIFYIVQQSDNVMFPRTLLFWAEKFDSAEAFPMLIKGREYDILQPLRKGATQALGKRRVGDLLQLLPEL